MLDLEPGVHLDEVARVPRLLAGDDELDGARAHVPDGPRGPHRVRAHAPPRVLVQQRRGRLLDDLLVAALEAALALAEVDDVAVGVGQHLDLDVPGIGDEPLDQQRGVPERGGGRAARRLDGLGHLLRRAHDQHALAAAARRGLDQHGIADAAGRLGEVVGGLRSAGDDGHARRRHGGLGADLVAHRLDGLGRRADEDQALLGAAPRERGVLGQEPIPGVHGPGPAELRGRDHLLDVEVAGGQPYGRVGLADVPGARVRVAVHGDGPDAEPAQGSDDAERDLAPVGDKNGVEHDHIRKTP